MVISAGDLILNHTSFYSAGTRSQCLLYRKICYQIISGDQPANPGQIW